MTYFKDHRGRTVIHLAAKDGAMAACELIIKMRRDAIFDTDKQVSMCVNLISVVKVYLYTLMHILPC